MEERSKISRFSRLKNRLKNRNLKNKILIKQIINQRKKILKAIKEQLVGWGLIISVITLGGGEWEIGKWMINTHRLNMLPRYQQKLIEIAEKKYTYDERMVELKCIYRIKKEIKNAQKALEDSNIKLCLNEIINAKGDISKLRIIDKREYLAQVLEIEKGLKSLLELTLDENFEDVEEDYDM